MSKIRPSTHNLELGVPMGYNPTEYAPVAQSDRALASEARCGGSSPSGRTSRRFLYYGRAILVEAESN